MGKVTGCGLGVGPRWGLQELLKETDLMGLEVMDRMWGGARVAGALRSVADLTGWLVS